ncbi:unnamed protein product, partial [Staurois parvus]
MRGDQRVNCVLGVFYYVGCVCVLLQVHSKAIQSSVQEQTGERSVWFTYRSLPHWKPSEIAGCRRGITDRDPVIDSRGRKWQHV